VYKIQATSTTPLLVYPSLLPPLLLARSSLLARLAHSPSSASCSAMVQNIEIGRNLISWPDHAANE